MKCRRPSPALRATTFTAALLLARAVQADPGTDEPNAATRNAAVRLHDAAERALHAGDWSAACPLYAQSQALDPSATTRARMAQCEEQEGHPAAALRAYREALSLVPSLDASRQKPVAELVTRHIARLEPRVPSLAFDLAAAPHGAAVTVDAAELSPEDLASPVLVDPGSHTIAVAASGFEQRRCSVTVNAGSLPVHVSGRAGGTPAPEDAPAAADDCTKGSDGSLSVVLSSVPVALPATIAVPAVAPVEPGHPEPQVAPPRDDPRATARTVGWILGATGVATLGVAGVLGVRTLMLVDGADCDAANVCSVDGKQDIDAAHRSQTAGFVALGVGATLLASGVTVLLFSTKSGAPASASRGASLALRAVPASRSVSVEVIW
jgi:hypothetical protein